MKNLASENTNEKEIKVLMQDVAVQKMLQSLMTLTETYNINLNILRKHLSLSKQVARVIIYAGAIDPTIGTKLLTMELMRKPNDGLQNFWKEMVEQKFKSLQLLLIECQENEKQSDGRFHQLYTLLMDEFSIK